MRLARDLRSRLAHEYAFTLPELLTVLAILGVVLGALTTMFVSGTNAEREMNVRFQAQQNARMALSKLRREIRCASDATATASLVTLTMGATCTIAQGSITWSALPLGPSRYGLFRCQGLTCDTSGTKWADYLTSNALFSYIPPSGNALRNLVTTGGPSSAAVTYQATGARFGPPPAVAGIPGPIVLVNDGSASPTLGCRPLINTLAGAIALVIRGSCPFVQKVHNAQEAGAVAVIVVNDVGGAPITMGGTDPTAAIPAVMVSLADGNALKAGLPTAGLVSANPAVTVADARPQLQVSLPVDLEPARPGGSYTLQDTITFRNAAMLATS